MKTNLKQIRKARGYKNAKDFAESIGMQEKTYRNYENGSRNLYLDVACKLCTALDCSLEELTRVEYAVANLDPEPDTANAEREEMTKDESELLETYRELDDTGKLAVRQLAKTLSSEAGRGGEQFENGNVA